MLLQHLLSVLFRFPLRKNPTIKNISIYIIELSIIIYIVGVFTQKNQQDFSKSDNVPLYIIVFEKQTFFIKYINISILCRKITNPKSTVLSEGNGQTFIFFKPLEHPSHQWMNGFDNEIYCLIKMSICEHQWLLTGIYEDQRALTGTASKFDCKFLSYEIILFKIVLLIIFKKWFLE